jgi:3D (Asp-Asp-Asp) domain-containing protein
VLLTLLVMSLAALATTSLAASPESRARRQAQPVTLASPLQAPTVVATRHEARHRVVMMEVTAYCPCKICCGRQAHGVTASGKKVTYNGGAFVAADEDVLAFHTRLVIPGYKGGKPVPVMDRGGDIVGNHIDVFFPTHREAQKWGRKMLPVTILDER